MTTNSNSFVATVTIAGLALICAAHAEDAYELMTGGMVGQSQSPPAMVLAYGQNPTAVFPPRVSVKPHSVETAGMNKYCVRTCDGRYFPISLDGKQSAAEGCKNLCPASETQIFSGSSIDAASSSDGRSYSTLPNAFRYRKELVAECTCNGKDTIGLASIKVEDDKTLRRGDMVATKDGLEVVTGVGTPQPSFAAASTSVRNRFQRPPVLASQ
jgi:Protein of unknown function (DUF2865)